MKNINKPFKLTNDWLNVDTNTVLIEKTLESLGFYVKIVEICVLDDFIEYYMEVAMGTNLGKLEKHDKDLALSLASPTGKVYWEIPVPGKTFVGLKVPKPSKEYLEKIKLEEDSQIKDKTPRSRIAYLFFILGQVNYFIAKKILGNDKSDK